VALTVTTYELLLACPVVTVTCCWPTVVRKIAGEPRRDRQRDLFERLLRK
jgi:hypothetical protein